MKIRVLWIEDQAISMLEEYCAKVINDGKYSLKFVLNASEGIKNIQENIFDIVIIDIRLEPGSDTAWKTCILKHGGDKKKARLGMELLKLLFMPHIAEVEIPGFKKPYWVRPEIFGVLTVESRNEVDRELSEMKINSYKRKIIEAGASVLIDLIEEIINLNK